MRNTPPKKKYYYHGLDSFPFQKNGTVYLAVISLLVVITIILYALAGLLDWLDVPMQTVTATTCETGVGCYTTGYIVRQEQVLTSNYSMTNLALGEGQKIAAGQTVAYGYATNDAWQRQSKINQLEERLQQLQYAGGGSVLYDQAAMDAEIQHRLLEIARLQNRSDYSSVAEVSTQLKGMILRSNADDTTLSNIGEQIASVQTEINTLRNQSNGQTENVVSPVAGYFSGTVDGYESVLTPDYLNVVSVSELEQVMPAAQPQGAVGKIILGDTWYYVTTVTEEYEKNLTVGGTVNVSFAHDISQDLPMKVSRISPTENGKCVVVLSTNHFIQDVTMMRSQSADMLFGTYSGLHVPKSAVRVLEDGTVGVYVLEITNVKWKPVNILYDKGEDYIVELDKSSTGHLWPGDEIILQTEDIYDGKVVVQ